ncbi:hypothetical protein [Aquibacillus salsiterrae]|uniref:Uncharacterized protein n=1 Tax=Aquibacillus salsiterrae TaxID=2950439 RepID=A0A9X3WCX9_9BACI|nr:hypothetical protein [Aquibacillus salsiterrae]MDC3417560.1 hypothetical protein [Aquibacillus salsiterrae]
MESFLSEISEDLALINVDPRDKDEVRAAIWLTSRLDIHANTIINASVNLSEPSDEMENIKRFEEKLAKLPKLQQKVILEMIKNDFSDEDLKQLFYVSETELPQFKEIACKRLRELDL